jgi:hypothetical protein
MTVSRYVLFTVVALSLAVGSARASTITATLGDQDFIDGQMGLNVALFTAPSVGEPAPFNAFCGSDLGATTR